MPCLSGRFDAAIGPLINVGVFPAGTLTPGSPIVSQKITGVPALLDTGASATCISPDVTQGAGLHPIGMRPMVSATQTTPRNVYLVDLLLQFGALQLVLPSTQVMEFSPAGGSPFQILVGRDIICRGVLTISFDGHFTLCL